MSYDHGLYQDFGGEPPSQQPSLNNVFAGRDVLIAKHNVHVHNYVEHLAMLRQHPIDRKSLLHEALLVAPAIQPGGPDPTPLPVSDPVGSSVLALLGHESSGRRTTALHLLDMMLTGPEQKIFELYPDWEEPEVTRIPSDPGTGYVLNLTSVQDPLTTKFHDQLAEFAMRARSTGTSLIIITTARVWNSAGVEVRTSPIRILTTSRPSALSIAQRRIEADPQQRGRAAWLTEPASVFHGLLRGDEPPAEGVRLADIILQAKGSADAEARDRFLGWEHTLTEWFGGTDPRAPERRALQIAAAFLDGSPARTVLDAADALLADPALNWPTRQGGPLAGADDSERCLSAAIDFSANGTVSISGPRPGIDRALLQHVWRRRPQLVPVLTRWISAISKPSGVADGSLHRLADTLTAVAESEGPDAVLNLANEWLLTGKPRHTDLAVDVLDRLAVHPGLGSAVRRKLSSWAEAHSLPHRQRAVVAVCRGRLGQQYTRIALTRLKYVLDKAHDNEVRQAAAVTLQIMIVDPELSARVLSAAVEWAASPDPGALSRTAFLEAFQRAESDRQEDPAYTLLTAEGDRGDATRELLREGWRAVWQRPELRTQASQVLGDWCEAADSGKLPADLVEEIVAVVFAEEADALGDDLDRVIGGPGAFRVRLRQRFVDVVRETATRRAARTEEHSATADM